MKRHDFALQLVLAAGAASGLTAQSEDSTARWEPTSRGCFRGRPQPFCRAFMITEFGVARELALGTGMGEHSGTLATWEFGSMVNLGSRHAIGVALVAHALDAWGIGIRPRYRTWLSPTVSLDVAAGILVRGRAGFTGQVALDFADYAALTAQVLSVGEDFGQGRRRGVRFYLGGRLGSVPGAVTGIAVPLFVIAAFVIACAGGGCN
ncbi:MAG: hypothetical protein ABI647_12475 [Gemmatimonadota bacterium]